MRVPRLVWNRRHNIAALTVSYGRRIWHTREAGDLILGYNATGRLSRVVILDPRSLLAPDTTVSDAIVRVTTVLLRVGDVRQADLDVLRSALERANTGVDTSLRARRQPEKGSDSRTLPLSPRPGPRFPEASLRSHDAKLREP